MCIRDSCEAIRQIAEQECSARGLDLRMECDLNGPGTGDQQLFAIARELIMNAARHSKGTEVFVRIARTEVNTHLEIADDGAGFGTEARLDALRSGHLGLVSVKDRARALGADLQVRSDPDLGTRVVIAVPATAPA